MSEKCPMPLHCSDFITDTSIHLSLEQTGAYVMLLALYWNQDKPVPDDEKRICRTLHVTPTRWRKHIRPAIERFFDLSSGSWTPIAGHTLDPDPNSYNYNWMEWEEFTQDQWGSA